MEEAKRTAQERYVENIEKEWKRMRNKPEFFLTTRMLNRYIKPGEKVLDIGGGPGRYSLYLSEKGCQVRLVDISPENIRFAKKHAAENNLAIETVVGDAAELQVTGLYDHILLMGPMSHLIEEDKRVHAVETALKYLKPGGMIFVSFINITAGIIYAMKEVPELVCNPEEEAYLKNFIENNNFGSSPFTHTFYAYYMAADKIVPFMSQFPLEKMHLFGQEGITSPCEKQLMAQPLEVIDNWLDLCEEIWEREDLLSWSEHLMYVGRKI